MWVRRSELCAICALAITGVLLVGCEKVMITSPEHDTCLESTTGGADDVHISIDVVPGGYSEGTVFLDGE
jgi:hypothetical protein